MPRHTGNCCAYLFEQCLSISFKILVKVYWQVSSATQTKMLGNFSGDSDITDHLLIKCCGSVRM